MLSPPPRGSIEQWSISTVSEHNLVVGDLFGARGRDGLRVKRCSSYVGWRFSCRGWSNLSRAVCGWQCCVGTEDDPVLDLEQMRALTYAVARREVCDPQF